MKYDIGDVVLVRADLEERKDYGKHKAFSDVMDNAGELVTISHVHKRSGYYSFEEAIGRGFLTDEMIEEEAMEEEAPTQPISSSFGEDVAMWKGMYDDNTFKMIMQNHIITRVKLYENTDDLVEAVEYIHQLKTWEDGR